MFTVIIADDEPRICELIRYLIDWEKWNLTLLGSVHDGQSLYNMILQQRPDIVITDVVMPRMTGLEIIQKVGQEGIDCNFVIISGHRYFEYVQEAMKNGACDYLLKPINGEELNETLGKICAKMTDKLRQEMTVSSRHKEIEQTRQILKRHLIYNAFLFRSESFDDLERLNREYSVAFGAGEYQAVILSAEGQDAAAADMILQKAVGILESQLQTAGGYVVSYAADHRAYFLINYQMPMDELDKQIEKAFGDVLHLANMFSGVNVTLGCGKVETQFSEIPRSIRTARLAIRDRIKMGRNRVIWSTRYEAWNGAELEMALDREQLQQLAHILDGLNQEKYEAWIKSVCEHNADTWSGNAWYELCEKIGELFDRVIRVSKEPDGQASLTAELIASLEQAPKERLMQALIQPVTKRLEALSEDRLEQSNKPIRLAKEYIQAHYMEPIRLEDVANHVYLHPAYLSHIFKETLGIGFSDYVANCRLERAKYLLTHTNETIYGIARQVGYTEPRAFSKFFQKNVGVKPSDYRRMYS